MQLPIILDYYAEAPLIQVIPLYLQSLTYAHGHDELRIDNDVNDEFMKQTRNDGNQPG
jgi:hypothetical protein